MADASNYLRDEFISWMIEESTFPSAPSNLYVSLHTGDPGVDGQNNEVSATNYSRYESSPSDWNRPQNNSFSNSTEFIFNQAQEDWGDISHFAIWDGPDPVDNMLAVDSLLESVEINAEDTGVFREGNLSGVFQ